MKKTTVDIKVIGGDLLTLAGWQTDVPGLIVAKFNPTPDVKTNERWVLWHSTGYHVRTFKKRAHAEAFANILGEHMPDWSNIDSQDSVPSEAVSALQYALAKGN